MGRLSTLPPSCAICLEILEPQAVGSLSRPVMEYSLIFYLSSWSRCRDSCLHHFCSRNPCQKIRPFNFVPGLAVRLVPNFIHLFCLLGAFATVRSHSQNCLPKYFGFRVLCQNTSALSLSSRSLCENGWFLTLPTFGIGLYKWPDSFTPSVK